MTTEQITTNPAQSAVKKQRRAERIKAFQVLYSLCFSTNQTRRALLTAFNDQPDYELSDLLDNAEDIAFYEKQPIPATAGATAPKPNSYDGDNARKSSSSSGKAAKDGKSTKATKIETIPSIQVTPEGFAWNLTEGVWRKQEQLDKLISSFSQNWRLDRMGKVELTILRISLYELTCNPDTPAKVVINEGIELSKQFGDDNSRSFVNGILDAAAKASETGSWPEQI